MITLILTTVWCMGGYSQQTWEKVNLSDLKSNDVFVIVDVEANNAYALTNNNGTSNAPSAKPITLSKDKNSITSVITDELKWYATNNNNKFTFYSKEDKSKWLYCTKKNNGVRVGINPDRTFIAYTSGSYSGLKHIATNRYIGVYNGQDWRCYTSTTTNISSTNICYYKLTLEPTVKKPTLSFSEESVTVMQGKENKFIKPTLTLTDAEGNPVVNDILISYSVSPAEGIVSISNETGDITKWIAPGTATVTAEVLSENKAYEGMTASYTINYVKDPNAVTAFSSVNNLWLALSTDELKDGDKVKVTLTDAKVVYINEYEFNGTQNTEVFIREAESAVDFFNLGVDFTNNAIVNGTIQGKIQESRGMFRLTADGVNTIPSDLTITASDEAAAPVDITDKEITDYTYNYVSFLGLADESNIIYNNSKTSITLYDKFDKGIAYPYAGASVNITGIAIPYKKNATSGTIYEIIPTDKYGVIYLFDDNTDNTVGKVDDAKVALTRTLVGDKWNTFCVPFGISENDVKTVMNNAELREYGSMNETTMNFTPATSITAGKAYLVKPTADVVNPAFEGVSIIATAPTTTDGDNGYTFQGTYSKKTLETDGTNLFLGADMKFYVPAAETNVMKGLRAYFVVPAGPSASKMDINIDGELTNICNIENGVLTNGKVYNLNGQYIGNSLNNLQKGIYIVNGRKVMK